MPVVSDTSPICYLILIREIDILAKLFRQVLIPRAVLSELCHDDAPTVVRDWASNLPTWIIVHEDPHEEESGLERLQPGEKAAILLAKLVRADMILLDEKAARRVAAVQELRVTGTLAVLGEASLLGLIDLTTAVEQLGKTNFRYSPALLRATLDRFSRRQV